MYDRELLAIVASMKQWRHPREVFPDNQGTLTQTGTLGGDTLRI
jgi:hypothetical protein